MWTQLNFLTLWLDINVFYNRLVVWNCKRIERLVSPIASSSVRVMDRASTPNLPNLLSRKCCVKLALNLILHFLEICWLKFLMMTFDEVWWKIFSTFKRQGVIRFRVRRGSNKWPFVFAQTTVLILLVSHYIELYMKASENMCNNIQHLYKLYKYYIYTYINISYKFMRSFDQSYIFI